MIEAIGLSKRYGGTLAVDDLSFTVPPGQVTGFLGPNGAGKSTTMRLILGLDAPTSGSVTVGGKPYRSFRRPLFEVGALLEAKAVHGGRSAYSHLMALALSNGIPRTRVETVLDQVGLRSVARKRSGGFSLGMGQRLGIAAAMLGDPGVLIFDEPANGLDPEGVLWIRTLLKALAAEGRTVFLSSHLMSEMTISRGRLIAETSIEDFLAGGDGSFVQARLTEAETLAVLLRARGVSVARQGPDLLRISGADAATVGEIARTEGLALLELSTQQATLEQRYMELTGDSVDYGTAGPSDVLAPNRN